MELIDRIDGHTRLITLVGSPVAHSASPATHTLSFEKLGMNIVYLAFDVQPDDLSSVMGALRAMRGWDGTNVTMPCKQAIIPYLDELSPAAELMGSVNVVKKESDGRLTGHNTDGAGFMQNLRKHDVKTEGARMTLMGSGGAGSAILVQAALDGMTHIDVFAREGGKSYQHARNLIDHINERADCEIDLHDFTDQDALRAAIAANDILTNATNVGMGEDCVDVPLPADMIRPSTVVADVIYLPRETQLIRNAVELGCITVPGLGMMLEQAAEGERIWYEVEMPTDEIAAQLFA